MACTYLRKNLDGIQSFPELAVLFDPFTIGSVLKRTRLDFERKKLFLLLVSSPCNQSQYSP